MNALHLTLSYFEPNSGVIKKINSQVAALKNNGFEKVYMGMYDEEGNIRINNEVIAHSQSISNLPGQHRFFSKLLDYIRLNNISFIYYRFNATSEPSVIWFFRSLKKMGITSVMEIPTYPYDGEQEKNRFYYLDKFSRRFLAKQFKGIVTFSDKNKIFGQRTINISNGVDFHTLPLRCPKKTNNFNFLGVANYRYWHGFDRMLYGIKNYVQRQADPKIFFHIVTGNENSDIKELRKLIEELHLQQFVKIYGEVSGSELDILFNTCDLAIGSLGRHRNNIFSLKTLKNVEYAARGIPFVYSEENEDFDDKPYIRKVTPDDTPIDITSLIDFARSVLLSPLEIRNSVKELSWDEQIRRVLMETQSRP